MAWGKEWAQESERRELERAHGTSRGDAWPVAAEAGESARSRTVRPSPFRAAHGPRGRVRVETPVLEWSGHPARQRMVDWDSRRDGERPLMRRERQPARDRTPAAELPPRRPLCLRRERRIRPRGDWEPARRPFRCRPGSGPSCPPDGSVPLADAPTGKRSESS